MVYRPALAIFAHTRTADSRRVGDGFTPKDCFMFRPQITYAVAVAAALALGALAVASIGFSGTEPAKSADAPVPGSSGDRPMDQSGLLRWIK